VEVENKEHEHVVVVALRIGSISCKENEQHELHVAVLAALIDTER
jgi:hypothetical protein